MEKIQYTDSYDLQINAMAWYFFYSIIAVSYEAQKFGVTRNMRGDEAKEKCPEIILARVPEARGKADLTRYREAGAEVIEVLQTFSDICERASVDEAYLDLTETIERYCIYNRQSSVLLYTVYQLYCSSTRFYLGMYSIRYPEKVRYLVVSVSCKIFPDNISVFEIHCETGVKTLEQELKSCVTGLMSHAFICSLPLTCTSFI